MIIKNKLIAALLLLLVMANIATIALYWLGKKKTLPPLFMAQKQFGPPSQFLIKELTLDSIQQLKYLDLVKKHQTQTKDLRERTIAAKDHFFDLIKQPVLNDSIAKSDVSQISLLTVMQDMATLQHFRQVRALCNVWQQQKFDSIIHQMLGIMAVQKPNMPPPNNNDEKQLDDKRLAPIHNWEHPPPTDGQKLPPQNGDKQPPPPSEFPPPPPNE